MRTTIIAILMTVLLSGCATGGGRQWPILPEFDHPHTPKIGKVELMEEIRKLPHGDSREQILLLTDDVIDKLVEAWKDTTFWGYKMEAVIRTYNEEAAKHNSRIK